MHNRSLKLLLGLLGTVLGIALCVCLYLFAVNYNTASTVVGYIGPDNGASYLNISDLEQRLTLAGNTFEKNEKDESLSQAAARMIEAEARIIIAEQLKPEDSAVLAKAAQASSTTLLFVGSRPRQSVLTQSDKAWYLGSNEAHGGELLGTEIANNFKEGSIADTNNDHILQIMVVNESEITQYALEESEHLGVYTQVLDYNDELGNALPFTAEAFAEAQKPEFILCSTDEDARAAYDLAHQIGWQDVRIGCAAPNKAAAQKLRDGGITDLPIPYYDVETVTAAAADFALNALDFQFISQNTELIPNDNDHFLVPYQLFE